MMLTLSTWTDRNDTVICGYRAGVSNIKPEQFNKGVGF